MKASLLGLDERFKYFKNIFSLSMAATLLSSSNEGLMGLVEKHQYTNILFIFCFSMRVPPLIILKSRDLRKNLNGGGSLHHLTAHQMRDVATNRWWER
jgi:hypothetical protein